MRISRKYIYAAVALFVVAIIAIAVYNLNSVTNWTPKVEILSSKYSVGAAQTYLLKLRVTDANSVTISTDTSFAPFSIRKELTGRSNTIEQEIPLSDVNTNINISAGTVYGYTFTYISIQRDKTSEDVAREEAAANAKAEQAKKAQEEVAKQKAEADANRRAFLNTPRGRKCGDNGWSEYECDRVMNNEVWIGMSISMLHAERGLPNSVNPSDFGNGKHYQWCWTYKTPRCFYGGEDGIVTSYN